MLLTENTTMRTAAVRFLERAVARGAAPSAAAPTDAVLAAAFKADLEAVVAEAHRDAEEACGGKYHRIDEGSSTVEVVAGLVEERIVPTPPGALQLEMLLEARDEIENFELEGECCWCRCRRTPLRARHALLFASARSPTQSPTFI